MNVGDLVECKREGFTARVLGGVLRLFDPEWDGFGWHVRIAWDKGSYGWFMLEATGDGVRLNYYDEAELSGKVRCHTWLDIIPPKRRMNEFLAGHIGKKYDVAVYFWTALQYLLRHYFNRRIPRLLDDRYTCWELAAAFFDAMGKPVHSKYDCPMLPDMLRTIDGTG